MSVCLFFHREEPAKKSEQKSVWCLEAERKSATKQSVVNISNSVNMADEDAKEKLSHWATSRSSVALERAVSIEQWIWEHNRVKTEWVEGNEQEIGWATLQKLWKKAVSVERARPKKCVGLIK